VELRRGEAADDEAATVVVDQHRELLGAPCYYSSMSSLAGVWRAVYNVSLQLATLLDYS
jgi:hypothetical protein